MEITQQLLDEKTIEVARTLSGLPVGVSMGILQRVQQAINSMPFNVTFEQRPEQQADTAA